MSNPVSHACASSVAALKGLQRIDGAAANTPPTRPVFKRLQDVASSSHVRNTASMAALESDCTKLLTKVRKNAVNDVPFKYEGGKAVVHFNPDEKPVITVKAGSPPAVLTVSSSGQILYNGLFHHLLQNEELQAAASLAKAALAAAGGAANQARPS